METEPFTSGMPHQKPIFGLVSMVLVVLGFITTILVGHYFGVEIDPYLQKVLPLAVSVLAVISFIRRERAVWGIIGIILIATYIGIHLVAIP
jgi:hypothetical protein